MSPDEAGGCAEGVYGRGARLPVCERSKGARERKGGGKTFVLTNDQGLHRESGAWRQGGAGATKDEVARLEDGHDELVNKGPEWQEPALRAA